MELSIPFNRPYMTGKELWYIARAHANRHLSGDGEFTRRCQQWLERRVGCAKALLTHSCTGALEMSALLAGIEPGDEVILPSFTHPSTANAFVLRGAIPVFVDVRPDTLNIDESLIEAAITPKTKAIALVHYAGVSCEMDPIIELARAHDLRVIEDAAQALLSTYRGRMVGALGDLAALSFHETKNVMAGEGGALLINDESLIERAENIREKGTNRPAFFRGEVQAYTWVDIGSSYLPSELIGAFLAAQLEEADAITDARIETWGKYHEQLAPLEERGHLNRPVIPEHCTHNAHMYYILLADADRRPALIAHLLARGIGAVFHYLPLHSSPAGKIYGRVVGTMKVTDDVSARLLRLPLWMGLTDIEPIAQSLRDFFGAS